MENHIVNSIIADIFSCKEKKTSKDTAISSEKIESINITTEGGGFRLFQKYPGK